MNCWSSVDKVLIEQLIEISIECWSRVDWGYKTDMDAFSIHDLMTLLYHNPKFNQSLFSLKRTVNLALSFDGVSLSAPSCGCQCIHHNWHTNNLFWTHIFCTFQLLPATDSVRHVGIQNLVVISNTTGRAQRQFFRLKLVANESDGWESIRFSRLPCSTWTPPGKRKTGWPKATWRQTVMVELSDVKPTWGEALHMSHKIMGIIEMGLLLSNVPQRTKRIKY